MSQAPYIFPSYSPAIDTAPQDYPAAGAGEVRQTQEHARERSLRQASEAETIVGELVNQYFHRSTRMSGIFLCW